MFDIKSSLNKILHRDRNVWKWDLAIIGVFLLLVVVFVIWQPQLPASDEVRQWTEQFGKVGPLAIIGVIIVETVVAPIPGTIVPIVAGALYGLWLGFVYAWVGNMIGALIAFFISRRLGRLVVKKIIKDKTIDRYDRFLKRNKLFLWMVYLIPIFPLDIISFVIGLSALKFRHFLMIVGLGLLVNILILAYFGERLLEATALEKLVYIVCIVVIMYGTIIVERIIRMKGENS